MSSCKKAAEVLFSWTNVHSEKQPSVFRFASRLSVLPGVLLFLARLRGVIGGEGRGVARGLQVIKKFVPGGEFILTGHTAQVDFLL